MKDMKYPGAITKRTLWDRIVSWYLNWRYPIKVNLAQEIHANQELVDHIYNQMIDKTQLTIMPPIKRKE